MSGQAVDGRERPPHRLLADLGSQQAVPNRLQQLVDVGQIHPGVGANLEIEVMVFGTPHGRTGRVFADVEVVVVVAFVAGVEMKDRRPQTQRRQQPRFEVVELCAARRRAGQVEAPRMHDVVIDRPHDAFGIGVGAGVQVERLVLGRMDGVT